MAVLAVLLAVALPGVCLTLAVLPVQQHSLWRGVAGTVSLGYTTWALAAFALALGGVLSVGTATVVVAVVTAVAAAVAVRRGQPGAIRSAISRRSPFAAAGLLIPVAAVLVLQSKVPFAYNLTGAASLRYWGDAIEIAHGGAVPFQVVHWGSLQPPTVSKVMLNCFNALAVGVFGPTLEGLEQVRAVAAVLVAASLWAWLRSLGLRWTATAIVILLVGTRSVFGGELSSDLFVYKAETLGRAVAFSALALGIHAVTTSRRDVGLVAGLAFGAAAVTHLSATVNAGLFLTAYGLVHLLRTRNLPALAGLAVVTAVPAAVIAGLVITTSRGDLGFQGVASSGGYRSVLAEGFDPTRFYLTLSRTEAAPVGSTWGVPPRTIAVEFVQSAIGIGSGRWKLVVLAILAAVGVAVTVRGPPRLRRLPLVAGVFAAGIVILAATFALRYDTFIPAATGVRRLPDYAPLPVMLVAATAIESIIVALSRRRGWNGTAVAAGALAVTTAVGLAVVVAAGPRPLRHDPAGPAAALLWLRDHSSCGDRVLANYRTSGSFQTVAGRVAITEGMAPYLRPDMLMDTTQLLMDAQDFFARPTANRAFLQRHDVDLVYVAKQLPIGQNGRLGAPSGLGELPFLEQIHDSPQARVFRVLTPGGNDLPTAEGRPGYGC